jgi:hypothetical protein
MFFAVAKSLREFAARRTTSGDRVVVRIRRRLALLTAEVVSSRTVLICREPTLGTPGGRVGRTNLFHRDTDRLSVALYLLVESSECPLVSPRRTRAVMDVG